MTGTGAYGQDSYGDSPYGSAPLNSFFRVSAASSQSPTLVLVFFSLPLDLTYPAIYSTSNYSIPGLTVLSVTVVDATTVRLVTSLQDLVTYTVTVDAALSVTGVGLDPLDKSADFLGTVPTPVFTAVGTRKTRIRLAFSEAMLLNSALLDPASYAVVDVHNNAMPLTGVSNEQGASNSLAVVLTLSGQMQSAEWYVVTVGSGVVTASHGLTVVPATRMFQWVEPTLNASVLISKFSGEAIGGILGLHAGLVYFSPALDAAVTGTVIQVDSVEVCTKAFDTYTFPSAPDPPALYTFSSSNLDPGVLNGPTVLWGRFPLLVEASMSVTMQPDDLMPAAVDGPATATFTEPWDISYVALLNIPAWALYDGISSTTPPTFICANNLGPIPPGPTVVVVLQP